MTLTGASTSKGGGQSSQTPGNHEGWIGHPLDPIGCLYDTLTEASIVKPETIGL